MTASDSLPIPRKGVAYRVIFDGRKSDGTLITSGTGMDSEISLDQGTFADCTNEATEIATNSGIFFLDLTATEMNADCVALKVTWTNANALPQVIVLYPEEAGDIRVNVTRMAAGVIAAATFAANALDAVWSTGTRTLTSFGTLVADTAAAVWDRLTSTLTTNGSIGKWLLDNVGTLLQRTSGGVTVVSPVDAITGDLTLVRGDSYEIGTPRVLEWSSDDWAIYSVASVLFKARTRYSDTLFSKAGAMVSATLVHVELTAEETSAFAVGRDAYRFDLEGTTTDGDIVTLAMGKIHVLEDVR